MKRHSNRIRIYKKSQEEHIVPKIESDEARNMDTEERGSLPQHTQNVPIYLPIPTSA